MEQLQVTLASLTQTASSIRSKNQQLTNYLYEISGIMNQLSTGWK